ncbi:PucR family transcriptional regulator [Jiangella anatolica]|uniref:PucR family transcriptional regulator n=1 Tax=Jiangella anatolica TaxID=2670374 RepID=A0A2W2BLL8_9ACTN|nr:PucR family transcriptional regulator [Jiangella anatolica]PZF81214.1 hypothetical protein C1I92_22100 [Jiangella anatolica]
MELSMQQILESLAQRVGRPAVLEDRFSRLIAFSSHDRPIDDVREDSILRRHASPEVRGWLKRFALPDLHRPLRIPANPELHMLPRVCVPVRSRGKLLGHLWFVDADGTMSDADLAVCVQGAAELGEWLHRESVASLFSSARLADTMHMLLSSSPMSAQAARSLIDAGYMPARDGVIAVVLQGVPRRSSGVDIEDALAQAVADFRRAVRQGQALDLINRDHAVLLLSCAGDHDIYVDERVEALVELTRTALAADAALVVGVGSRRDALEAAYASFREARMSADAARLLPGLGDVVHWSRLGIHQIVVKLASLGEEVPTVHPGLGNLLDDPDALPLLETLETYLDVAGNAQLTAERLNLHRTSLYYRLQRLEQLAHTNLKSGAERLALHLSLKVARMTGQYAPRQAVVADAAAPTTATGTDNVTPFPSVVSR